MEKFPKKLLNKLSQRTESNALHSLPQSRPLIGFSSNDYLGMARNEELAQSTLDLLKKYMQA